MSNKLAPLPSLKLADHRFRVCRQTLGRKRAGSHTECQIAGQFFERIYPGVHGARRALQLLGNQTDLDPGCDELAQLSFFRGCPRAPRRAWTHHREIPQLKDLSNRKKPVVASWSASELAIFIHRSAQNMSLLKLLKDLNYSGWVPELSTLPTNWTLSSIEAALFVALVVVLAGAGTWAAVG